MLFVFFIIFLCGCVTTTDPITGETQYSLDPNSRIIPMAEAGTQVAIGLLPFLGPLGGAVATLIATGFAYWKKIKPKLITQTTLANQGYLAGSVLTSALTEFKETHPDGWAALGNMIQKNLDKLGPEAKAAENFIRGLRGLPPKA